MRKFRVDVAAITLSHSSGVVSAETQKEAEATARSNLLDAPLEDYVSRGAVILGCVEVSDDPIPVHLRWTLEDIHRAQELGLSMTEDMIPVVKLGEDVLDVISSLLHLARNAGDHPTLEKALGLFQERHAGKIEVAFSKQERTP